MLISNPDIINRMESTIQILDNLNEPWKKIDEQPTDINDCIDNAVKKGMAALTAYYINIEKYYAEKLPQIHTSPNMLTEAIAVIIKNAAEAIESKGKDKDRKIVISSQLQNDLIEIAIQDNGIGMKPDTLNRIFDLDFSTKDTDMGFGLFWAKDYLEGIGGEIKVESIFGSGSTFTIHIPTNRHTS
jgi:two-component system NtrC family sensor kinase